MADFTNSGLDFTGSNEIVNALRESDARYRNLFHNAPIGLAVSTPAGDIIDANKALLDIHGYASLDEYAVASGKTVSSPRRPG